MQPNDDADPRRLITIQQAADVLGLPVSTLRFWRAEKRGPKAVKLGRRVLYPLPDLFEFIRESEAASDGEAAACSTTTGTAAS